MKELPIPEPAIHYELPTPARPGHLSDAELGAWLRAPPPELKAPTMIRWKTDSGQEGTIMMSDAGVLSVDHELMAALKARTPGKFYELILYLREIS